MEVALIACFILVVTLLIWRKSYGIGPSLEESLERESGAWLGEIFNGVTRTHQLSFLSASITVDNGEVRMDLISDQEPVIDIYVTENTDGSGWSKKLYFERIGGFGAEKPYPAKWRYRFERSARIAVTAASHNELFAFKVPR